LGSKTLLAAVAILLLGLSPAAVLAETAITFQTDHQGAGGGEYDGFASITISGNVNPPPASGSVLVTVTNPLGVVMDSSPEPWQPGTGMFEDTVVTGCTPAWIGGTYTITIALAGSPQIVSSETFNYIVDSPALDTVSVNASPQSVSGSGTVTISGAVEACSGSAALASVVLTVKNPSGSTVYSNVAQPISKSSPENGNYSVNLAAGETPQWIPGTYTISAFFTSTQSVGTPATAAATFIYTGNTTLSSSLSTTQSTSISTTSQATSSATSAQSATSSAPATTSAPISATTNGSGASPLIYIVAIAIAAGVAGTFVGLRGRQKSPKT